MAQPIRAAIESMNGARFVHDRLELAGWQVEIAEETPGAIYFIVEPDHEQLTELTALVDAGELRAEVDSVFPLTGARAALERVTAREKRGKVVLEVGAD